MHFTLPPTSPNDHSLSMYSLETCRLQKITHSFRRSLTHIRPMPPTNPPFLHPILTSLHTTPLPYKHRPVLNTNSPSLCILGTIRMCAFGTFALCSVFDAQSSLFGLGVAPLYFASFAGGGLCAGAGCDCCWFMQGGVVGGGGDWFTH
mmetsp:Transcript_25486/g.40012  ORF Transcript_25486/g.40012 Transcript_25486/m.40012 type:complete len:148 (-) Transcript_25486:369-812(-)